MYLASLKPLKRPELSGACKDGSAWQNLGIASKLPISYFSFLLELRIVWCKDTVAFSLELSFAFVTTCILLLTV
jgi:hypothetical protein